MNVVFSLILFFGIGILIFTKPDEIMSTLMGGAESGLNFALKLFVIYAVWMSVLEILKRSGAEKGIAKLLSPIAKGLFKGENQETYNYISLNMSANLLGMGGAATPMGIKATETMKSKKNRIMLIVLNSSSLQLIPTTILAMRAEHDARLDIIIPCLIVNAVTTIVSIILVKVFVK